MLYVVLRTYCESIFVHYAKRLNVEPLTWTNTSFRFFWSDLSHHHYHRPCRYRGIAMQMQKKRRSGRVNLCSLVNTDMLLFLKCHGDGSLNKTSVSHHKRIFLKMNQREILMRHQLTGWLTLPATWGILNHTNIHRKEQNCSLETLFFFLQIKKNLKLPLLFSCLVLGTECSFIFFFFS